MTAKRISTRLAFSLVLVVATTSLASGQISPAWFPNIRGLDIGSYYGNYGYYPGPIAPYAYGFFPYNGWYNVYSPPYYVPLPGGWSYVPGAGSFFYWDNLPRYYPPPYYGGYYAPNTGYWWNYSYPHRPWQQQGWQRYRGLRDRPASPQAPTEVPRRQ